MQEVTFIDLFAGMGGLRLGFESAFQKAGIKTKCVMTSEIKPFAVSTLHHNFKHDFFVGDITKVTNDEIPTFDFLLGGFPCQPFSAGGRRQGFLDTRGTLFFEIERILDSKKPFGFILENVEGLVKHDLVNRSDEMGLTLSTILGQLNKLGYNVTYKVLDSANFGLPQSRKRIYIVGTLKQKISLEGFEVKHAKIKTILEKGLKAMDTKFTKLLLSHFDIKDLHGKSIKDKRGGSNNIHSWEIGLKGKITKDQSVLLAKLFKERRKKHWALEIGIKWMDGIPLTLKQISTFHNTNGLEKSLDDLVKKGYLKFEHPKTFITEKTDNGNKTYRKGDQKIPKGYNIVSGKLSFEINKILDPNGIAPTLVATDMEKLVVVDKKGLRRMTLREGLRMFGYPESYMMPVKMKDGFDLLGNTVAVNVVEAVAGRLADAYLSKQEIGDTSLTNPSQSLLYTHA